ncbi:BTB/POZ domain-containing protein [Glomus cerebriforme]|uniref:BTB/POZ domain-containing protein n=1 Tax=Glomus cerebriforme TaxID=658196 RepID=A0A397TFK1_9GLOM|nr:BTB/POZ domain-containing protein [Glomus cerebriforme]
MSDKHPIHYYDDGDILLKAENTSFLLHKSILSLSSEFFKDLFKLSKPSANENVKFVENKSSDTSIPTIELHGETSESIERMLSFIYPNSYVKVTWDNVEDFLRLSDKFMINKITKHCGDFLYENIPQNTFFALRMADKYSLPEVFKESSKLVLDDLEKYRLDSDYNKLSEKAKLKLLDSWVNYAISLNKFVEGKSFYFNNRVVKLKDHFAGISTTPVLKPSKLMEQIKTNANLRSLKLQDDCGKFIKNYEPLKNNSSENAWYIFAALED